MSASHQGLIIDTITEYRKCLGKGLSVGFLWTPAHMGIWGNERADKVAKEAVKRSSGERGTRRSEGTSKVCRKAIEGVVTELGGRRQGKASFFNLKDGQLIGKKGETTERYRS